MEPPKHRRWMIDRLRPGRGEPTPEFVRGVKEFDAFAKNQRVFTLQGVYRCPCAICKNKKFHPPDHVKTHLYRRRFLHGYWYWTSHGETEPQESDAASIHHGSSSHMHIDNDNQSVDTYETMVRDAFGYSQTTN